VLINRRLNGKGGEDYQSVYLDDEISGEIATRHLIQSGHSKIGYLAGPASSFSGQGRKKGYQSTMKKAGLPLNPDWIFHCQPTVDGGHQGAIQLLKRSNELTAVFCYNDLVAVGALQACTELDRGVPQDIAIVGHDDIPLAALVSPALTTCRVSRHELGTRAVEALLERMKNCPVGCDPISLHPELIIRQSAP